MTLVAVDSKQYARLKSDQVFLEKTLFESAGPKVLDLDKAWHGIHFLLTGSSRETTGLSSSVILGGEKIGKDIGYGSAAYHSPETVKQIAKLLKSIPLSELSKRFNPIKMDKEQVYPDIWKEEGDQALAYLLEYYKELVAFYSKAAKSGKAVLFAVT
ncbi:MAG: YfbM family protein [Holophagaceae bacterium]|nr:YfbM family protein [Holophagaceae bacterium]